VTHMDILDRFAASIGDATLPPPRGVVSVGGSVDPKRFAVYRNNVFVGLTRALASRFPACERLVGAEFFTAMARIYCGSHKPASPLLFDYGDDFPDFIARFPPAASVPYLADVARVEVAFSRAYHAADLPALEPFALTLLDPSRIGSQRLAPHVAAAIIVSAYPVGSIWEAQQTEQPEPVVARGGQAVIVVRPELKVSVHVLPPQDVAFARALLGGATLGEAAGEALAVPGFDFGTALVGLVRLGAFSNKLAD
jgi:hypothetical protein